MSGRLDDLYISVGGRTLSGWKTASVTRSAEACPAQFHVTASDAGDLSDFLQHNTDVVVSLRDEPVITGAIDDVGFDISPTSHDVSVIGRSKCRNIVDNNIEIWSTRTITGKADVLAEHYCAPWGVKVRNESRRTLPDIPYMPVSPLDTPHGVVERMCRTSGVLVFDDAPTGDLLITDVGMRVHAGTLRQGHNVQRISRRSMGQSRYTTYNVLWATTDPMQDTAPGTNRRATIEDPELKARGIKRNLNLVSEQTVEGQDYAEQRGRWECNRRWGRSQALKLTVDSWFDEAGKLWAPNWLVDVDYPKAKVSNVRWIIVSVTYTKDEGSGTTADLVIMPREALDPQPLVLNRQNADIYQGLGAVR